MNALFLIIFIVCGAMFCFSAPNDFFKSIVDGGQMATTLCIKLLAIYAISMGVIKIAESSGIIKKISRALFKVNNKLFLCSDQNVCEHISTNIAANFLGMGGAATTSGIAAMQGLSKQKNASYSTAVFFVVNAAGLQLLPLTIISLRSQAGSISPSDIILPSVLCSAISIICSLLLVNIFVKRH